MLTIRIHNDSTGSETDRYGGTGNYNIVVDANGREICKAYIMGHRRKDGWIKLVKKFLKVAEDTEYCCGEKDRGAK